ncbi:MAG TPA: enoyl-[acyl-carrier-protein] reductase FabI [Sutterella sp.]|nr:enoyl-[acyl-carrier-protein] reductase FabI [Sutterella sp.]
MGFLAGKTLLITGIASERSIALGVARACAKEGAKLVLTYASDRLKERLEAFAKSFDAPLLKMDVADDASIKAVFESLATSGVRLDGLLHAIAFAPRDAIAGNFLDGFTRENAKVAFDISAYSLSAVTREALPVMKEKASIVTLSYLGAEKFVPRYNTMGVAKAALEASVRYLAGSLGAQGVRVNAISAGPVKTLSSAAIENFSKMMHFTESVAPLRRCVTTEEIGNLAAFLFSDLSSAVTGEVIHADAGFSTVGAQMTFDEEGESHGNL